MHLSNASAEELLFFGRRSVGAPLLVGMAFVAVSVVPWVAPGPLNLARALAGVSSAVIAAVLLRAGWPRARRVSLRLRDGKILADKASYALDLARGFALTATPATEPGVLYRVELAVEGAEPPLVLLEGRKPDVLLNELRRALEFFPAPVAAGWGLPADPAQWSLSAPHRPLSFRPPTPEAIEIVTRGIAGARDVGLTVIGCGLGTAAIMVLEVSARLGHGDAPLFLDIALPIFTLTLVFTVAAAILSYGARVTVSDRIEGRVTVFGITLRRDSIDPQTLRGVYLVSPRGNEPEHVLFDTDAGALALPAAGRGALDLKNVLGSVLQAPQ